jgi:uncharacterized protein YjbI with pentapeptide repeats
MQDTTTFIITEEKEYQDCEMDKVVATGLDLSDSWFSHIAFDHGWFDRTNFRDCSFVNVMFLSCDLSESIFGGSHFKGCTFSGCKFLGSSFSDVVLQECRFADCIFNYGTWDKSRLKKEVEFSSCSFKNAGFTSIVFSVPPTFHTCDFTEATFTGTSLKGIDLSACSLDGIIVSDNFKELRGLKISHDQAVAMANLLGITVEG